MSRRIDLTGQRFGKLLVESIAPKRKSGNQYVTMWNCVCDCGNKTVVRSGDLRNGKTITCGNKRIHSHRTTHGMCGTRIYNIWVCMKTRCNNISDDRYGGRGISVCEEWKDDFQSFYDWSILNGYEDMNEQTVKYVSNVVQDHCRYKLIKYRPFGVRKEYLTKLGSGIVSDDELNRCADIARNSGVKDVVIV